MRLIRIDRPGGYDSLRFYDEPDPQPSADQCRVRVRAIGVNYADVIVREGYYKAAKGKYPITPGFEFAGTVDAIGPGSHHKIGDRVFGFTLFGGYSSTQIVGNSAVSRIPDDWSFSEAAALPATHLTAYHGLYNVARAQPGEVIVVHSAAGGVGTALLQQAKILGCKTIGVVGTQQKASTAEAFGATHVVIRSGKLWDEIDSLAPQGIDISFDANGITTPKPAYKRLRLGGRLVIYGFAEIFPRGKRPWLPMLAINSLRVPRFSIRDMTSTNRAILGLNVAFLADRKDLAGTAFKSIVDWAVTGQIAKPKVTEFLFDQAAEAHKYLESGNSTGKIMLTIDEDA